MVVVTDFDGVVKVEDTGRILIPAPVRRMMGIGAGDMVRLIARGGEVVIRPVTPTCYHCGTEIGEDELLRQYRICHECLKNVGKYLKQIV